MPLLKPKPEVKIYPEDENNLFHRFKTTEELMEGYKQVVKENGTSDLINLQFQRRKAELDIINWRSRSS
jgi:hypothetical protein